MEIVCHVEIVEAKLLHRQSKWCREVREVHVSAYVSACGVFINSYNSPTLKAIQTRLSFPPPQ